MSAPAPAAHDIADQEPGWDIVDSEDIVDPELNIADHEDQDAVEPFHFVWCEGKSGPTQDHTSVIRDFKTVTDLLGEEQRCLKSMMDTVRQAEETELDATQGNAVRKAARRAAINAAAEYGQRWNAIDGYWTKSLQSLIDSIQTTNNPITAGQKDPDKIQDGLRAFSTYLESLPPGSNIGVDVPRIKGRYQMVEGRHRDYMTVSLIGPIDAVSRINRVHAAKSQGRDAMNDYTARTAVKWSHGLKHLSQWLEDNPETNPFEDEAYAPMQALCRSSLDYYAASWASLQARKQRHADEELQSFAVG
ncbi:uncharacterized protein MKK02DRAFT_42113 [Dioszegia hungarica]|uniref:Uncharacterized protein n=1 Tax=Dioszegia hungarica TaxID=4972 RepID=A0AA38HEF0_9TREE|nr:uncharacterized protein MKK02DRAFT_42113 [Dioszegia hungarica]KAI9637744.1 hypothetical protein MKK02DRAFT_42113 [Dioszegia hungarica]